jgi:hypothetical protein
MTSPIGVLLASELPNKSLISDQLWQRLVNRIVKNEAMKLSLAERIMDQALGFLWLSAHEPDGDYSPSPLVDIGWHTFILYTREYAALYTELGAQFIHHAPSDKEGINYGTGNIARTVVALKRCGITVDKPLWANTGHDCDNCNGGDSGGAYASNVAMKADCSSYCSGDSCSGGGGDGDSGCSHRLA